LSGRYIGEIREALTSLVKMHLLHQGDEAWLLSQRIENAIHLEPGKDPSASAFCGSGIASLIFSASISIHPNAKSERKKV